MNGLAVRRTSAFFILVALLASITVIGAPGALAHHPEVSASSSCEGHDPVITFLAESWASGARGSNANIGIYVDGALQASGAFTGENGYSFDGTIQASAWAGQTVTVMARADGPWGNGNAAGDARTTTVHVPGDCGGTTTTEPDSSTTTVVSNPGTLVSGNPTCASLGYGTGIKDDSPGADTTIDGISFTYSGHTVSVSASGGQVINAVIVKGGNAANIYTTGPFQGLHAPINNGGQQAAISHVTVCVEVGQTTTTTMGTTTTTVESTTTTTVESTTTTVGTYQASVSIVVGYCREVSGVSMTPVTVTIEPAGAATVTINSPSGILVIDESTELMFGSGRHTWTAEATAGFVLDGPSRGTFRTADCSTPDGMVSVKVGECTYDVEAGLATTDVRFSIAPANAAQIVVEGPDGSHLIDGSGTTLQLGPGDYTWSASAARGIALVGITSGSFTVGDCSPECTAVIGDYVWIDMSPRNGLQDAGEESVEGVVVHLLDAEGTVLATTVTDGHGLYEFADLCAGTYRVHFELPDIAGLVNEAWTIQNGGEAAVDSNADANGLTGEIVVIEGTVDMTWDAGVVGDRVSPTTVTTLPPATSSTTVVEITTTTTEAETTSTTAPEPESTTTTVPPVTASTLPFTGFEMQATAMLGLLALAGGATLLMGVRRRPVEDGSDSIGGW
jgi:hypothetical protein